MAAEGQALSWSGSSRRRTPRYVVQTPLDVIVLRSGIPDKVPGRSVNLSEHGVGVVLAAELVPGEAVGVEFRVPRQAQPLRSRALVRYQDKLRCGMEFSGLSAEQETAIRSWTEELSGKREPPAEGDGASVAAGIPTEKIRGEARLNEARLNEDPTNGERLSNDKRLRDDNQVEKEEVKVVRPPAAGELARKPSAARRQGMVWKILVTICAILLAIFWWRWNRGWEELESGLPRLRDAPVEKPQLHVPAEEMQKLVIHRVDPDYPAAARQANLQSVIALDVVVGKDGSVVSMRPLNGPGVLARSAMEALRWWKFDPYRVNGKPVVVETTLAVEFKP